MSIGQNVLLISEDKARERAGVTHPPTGRIFFDGGLRALQYPYESFMNMAEELSW